MVTSMDSNVQLGTDIQPANRQLECVPGDLHEADVLETKIWRVFIHFLAIAEHV